MIGLQNEVIDEIVFSIGTWKHNHTGRYVQSSLDIIIPEKTKEIECALIDLFKLIKSIEG